VNRWDVLSIRDFRLLMGAKLLVTLGSQMQSVIVSWQIYQMTHDPLSLGLTGLWEALAFFVFALWAGHLADRSEKRGIMLQAQSLFILAVIGLWLLSYGNNHKPFWIYLLIGVTGIARSFLWSSSVSFLEQVVPKEIYSKAAAWNVSMWEIACIVGPAVGGFLFAWRGALWAYGISILLLILGLGCSFYLSPRPAVFKEKTGHFSKELLSGVRFVFRTPVILSALTLDMFAVLFGGTVALMPIFAEKWGSGAVGLGFLRAAPSLGAMSMAIYQMVQEPFDKAGKALLWAVTGFGIFMIGFALSPTFQIAFLFLVLSGAADNISVIARASILQAATPNAMRGRVSSVNGIFIGSSNEIGVFESGVAAKWMGTVPSVIFGGCMTLMTVVAVALYFPALRRLGKISDLSPADSEELV